MSLVRPKFYITAKGMAVNKKYAQMIPYIKAHFKIELVKTVGTIEVKKELILYSEDEKFLYMPIFGATKLAKKINLEIVEIDPPSFYEPLNLKTTIVLRSYQTDFLKRATHARQILCLPTGAGKTNTAIALIHQLNLPALIVVPNSTAVREQWEDAIKIAFPKIKPNQIIVELPLKAIKTESFRNYPIIVFDEIHSFCTRVWSQLFLTNAQFIIGLTATPQERQDNFDIFTLQNVGKIIQISSQQICEQTDISLPRLIYKTINCDEEVEDVPKNNIGSTDFFELCKIIQNNKTRFSIVINEIVELFNDKSAVFFVFVNLKTYAQAIFDALPPKIQSETSIFIGESNKKTAETTKKFAYEKARVIITTFSKSGKAINITRVNSIILASPKKSGMKQLIGRIFRTHYGAEQKPGLLIDIFDRKTPIKHQYWARRAEAKLAADVEFLKN
jgi:superfamily II DNA or RNA helicase